jgi:hypothetical protein
MSSVKGYTRKVVLEGFQRHIVEPTDRDGPR